MTSNYRGLWTIGSLLIAVTMAACGSNDTGQTQGGPATDTVAGEGTQRVSAVSDTQTTALLSPDPTKPVPGTMICHSPGTNHGPAPQDVGENSALLVNDPAQTGAMRYSAIQYDPLPGAPHETYHLNETPGQVPPPIHPEVDATWKPGRGYGITMTASTPDCTWTGTLRIYRWNQASESWIQLPLRARNFSLPAGVSEDSTVTAGEPEDSTLLKSEGAAAVARTTRFALGTG